MMKVNLMASAEQLNKIKSALSMGNLKMERDMALLYFFVVVWSFSSRRMEKWSNGQENFRMIPLFLRLII